LGDPLTRGTAARFGCAAALLAAATLKTYQLATDPALGILYGSRLLQVGLVQFEYALAIWLLSGQWPRYCRAAALVTFVGFAGVAAYLALTNAESCGCFGHVSMNPWLTLGIDITCALAVWRWRPDPAAAMGWMRASMGPMGAILLVAVAAPAVAAILPYRFTATGLSTDQPLVLLEPETWIGQRFPLFHEIDVGPRLSHGSWVIVLFHHECSHCQAILPRYEQLAQEPTTDGEGAFKIALIELPPYGANEPSSLCERGRLNADKEWFVETPAEILLQDGRVVDARTSDDVDTDLEARITNAFTTPTRGP
jgi:hypothetical protein